MTYRNFAQNFGSFADAPGAEPCFHGAFSPVYLLQSQDFNLFTTGEKS